MDRKWLKNVTKDRNVRQSPQSGLKLATLPDYSLHSQATNYFDSKQ